jgi:hypothetical protein
MCVKLSYAKQTNFWQQLTAEMIFSSVLLKLITPAHLEIHFISFINAPIMVHFNFMASEYVKTRRLQ